MTGWAVTALAQAMSPEVRIPPPSRDLAGPLPFLWTSRSSRTALVEGAGKLAVRFLSLAVRFRLSVACAALFRT
jgi:hypothetical protein